MTIADLNAPETLDDTPINWTCWSCGLQLGWTPLGARCPSCLELRYRPDSPFDPPKSVIVGKPADLSDDSHETPMQAVSQPALVTTDPDVCAGQPCFAGHRLPIAIVLGRLDAGESMPVLQRDYPWLTADHIAAAREALNLPGFGR